MKKLTCILFLCLIVSFAWTQSSLSAADWQADLRFLQKTVHEDYSFLFKKITEELCGVFFSKSQVSELTKSLDVDLEI